MGLKYFLRFRGYVDCLCVIPHVPQYHIQLRISSEYIAYSRFRKPFHIHVISSIVLFTDQASLRGTDTDSLDGNSTKA